MDDDENTCSRCHNAIIIPKDEHEWENGGVNVDSPPL